jgi:hypothetical protein
MQIQFNATVSNYFDGFRKIVAENATKIVALALVAISVFGAALYKLSQSQSHKMPKPQNIPQRHQEVQKQEIQNNEKPQSPKIQEKSTEKPKSLKFQETPDAKESKPLTHVTKNRPQQNGKRPPTRKPRKVEDKKI